MRGISRLAEELLATEECLCSMELVTIVSSFYGYVCPFLKAVTNRSRSMKGLYASVGITVSIYEEIFKKMMHADIFPSLVLSIKQSFLRFLNSLMLDLL